MRKSCYFKKWRRLEFYLNDKCNYFPLNVIFKAYYFILGVVHYSVNCRLSLSPFLNIWDCLHLLPLIQIKSKTNKRMHLLFSLEEIFFTSILLCLSIPVSNGSIWPENNERMWLDLCKWFLLHLGNLSKDTYVPIFTNQDFPLSFSLFS